MSELKDFNRMFSLDGKVALVTGGKHHYCNQHERVLIDITRLKRSRPSYCDRFSPRRRKEGFHLCA